MNIDKRIDALSERLNYIKDIFGNLENANISMLGSELDEFRGLRGTISTKDSQSKLARLEDLFLFLNPSWRKS